MSAGRGSGLAAATTMSSWSAFATTTRSTSSVSSALRRSTVRRGSIRMMRARVPGSPLVSPTTSTASPVTTPARPSSRARVAGTSRSSGVPSNRSTCIRPRSTVSTRPGTASS